MKINSITEGRSKQVKASAKKPKLNKPNLGHESPHPMQGRMVGEMVEYSMALGFTNLKELQKSENLDKLIATMQQDGINVMETLRLFHEGENLNALKNAFKNANFGDKAVMAGATATLIALLGLGNMSTMKDSPLGKELAVAAQQGDMVAAYHLENLDLYADEDMVRTIQNLKIAYIDDANREDVNAFLSDPKRFPGIKPKNESKEIKRSNPVAKHSRNMSGAGAHKDKKKELKKGVVKHKGKELEEAGYSASKSALVKAVINDLEKKALSDDADNLTFLNKLAKMIGKKVYKRDNGSLVMEDPIPFTQCPKCKGSIVHETQLNEKQDACYHKVKSRYKVWPSAYASGALVKCRKVGAKNWGNSSKKKKKKSKK